jgi:DNA-binding transcriptional LysR family regulator
MPTLISLVAAGMGISILPTSAVKHNVAAVVGCEIADPIPMSEIGLALARDTDSAVVKNFRSLVLETLVR